MLQYDRIVVSEGLNANKTAGLREYIICHYYYFLRINFRFPWKVSNGFHDGWPLSKYRSYWGSNNNEVSLWDNQNKIIKYH